MFELKIEGLEQLQQRLRDMKAAAEELDGTHEIPLSELLTENFMRANTEFASFSEMLDASGFKVETSQDFAAIPDDQWDAFVRSRTRFQGWNEMLGTAAKKYAAKELGFD